MQKKSISVSPSARKFMEERGIQDVTFNLKVVLPAGCCVGIIKEIEPVYEAVENASGYRYFQVEGGHVFVSREIKIIGPLTLNTEGLWRMKRLTLDGVTIPFLSIRVVVGIDMVLDGDMGHLLHGGPELGHVAGDHHGVVPGIEATHWVVKAHVRSQGDEFVPFPGLDVGH